MEESLQFYREHYYTILLADIVFGFLLGLIPLILGFKKQKHNLGIIGLVVSIIFSVVTPILSIISVIIFTVLLLMKSKPAEVVVVNENPLDVSVKNTENL